MTIRGFLAVGLQAAAVCSCGTRTEEAPPAPSGPPARRAAEIRQPQVVQQDDHEFSEDTSRFLATSDVKLTVVFHIAVREDGTMRSVEVFRVEPADLPVARKFAEEVSAAMPR